MKNSENINIQIQYGKRNLKEILAELLKQKYIEYITINQNSLFRADTINLNKLFTPKEGE